MSGAVGLLPAGCGWISTFTSRAGRPAAGESALENEAVPRFVSVEMSPPQPVDPAEKLDRFPLEVRDAFRRFRSVPSSPDLETVVVAVLRDHMPKRSPAPLADEMRLIEDLGYDSLAVAEMIFFFEDLFAVRIENRELLGVRTVGEVRAFVSRKLGAPPPAA